MRETNCVPANLARLRLDRGLTQAALAEKAGLSRLAVGKIERGVVVPRARTLDELAAALDAELGELILPVRPLRSVRFRARARMHGREQILAEVSRWLDGYTMLEERLGDAPDFGFSAAVRGDRSQGPRTVARAARGAAGLGRDALVPDICRLLEDHGVKVLPLDKKRESFFGLGVGPVDGGPAVVVNTWERISVERWIFTAAHELGHLLLHSGQYDPEAADPPASGGKEADRKSEREADAFASEFLMPESAFRPAWDATWGDPLLSRVLKVKRIFRVSYRTVLYRLSATKRAGPEVWPAFQVQHRNRFGKFLGKADEPFPLTESEARKWRRADEPDGLSENDFVENRLSRLVRRALQEEVITMGRAAEIMGLRRTAMRGWVGGWFG